MGRSENTFSLRDSVGTPQRIIDAIVNILGPIGLDPCSHPGSIVPAATRFYLPEYAPPGMPHGEPVAMPASGNTLAHVAVVGDGLVLPWGPGFGLVYVNPPYSRLSSEPWILRALPNGADVRKRTEKGERKRDAASYAESDEVVWLLPVRTAGSWWQTDLVATADRITFLNFRVQHVGEDDPSPFHQCLAYRGSRAELWQEKANAKLGWTPAPRCARDWECMGR